ncbi:hypothetical protein NLU13_0192 [Sarocladium strictum]|uniref:Uncharacterized protein n=1 Tax=Sarocladium strictum TaxID=5046 RepID=A0AA39GPE3_SARSR|nr:hypothetical protein NLU13_0192 [Sarocladium strictum]
MSGIGGREKPWMPLDSLSTEILALIFTELLYLDRTSLWAARRTSRRAAAVATPILYRTLELNKSLLSPHAADTHPGLYENIQRYTLEAVVASDLEPSGVRRVISWASRLQSIRWNYTSSPDLKTPTCWLLQDALDLRNLRSRDITLQIFDLPLQDFTASSDPSILTRTIPAPLMTTLTLGHPRPPLTYKVGPLKMLLLQAAQLKVFHYEDRGQGTRFRFDRDDGRMPAVEDLMLRSYDWDHGMEEVRRHWDFSKLRSLQLLQVPIYNFLSSIDPSHLRDLHTLRVEDFSAHLPDKRREATRALSDLVAGHITSLEVLDLVCHVSLFSIEALLGHRLTLRELRLRDHTGFGEEEHAVPTVSGEDLARLAREMPLLHTLELDMDVTQCNAREFLSAACRFGSLHTLTVHVQTLLRPLDAIQAGTDRDFEAAMATFRFLLDERDRVSKLPTYAKNTFTPWRRITINVGGWRRVMVRRVSSAWRERNEHGIFAERCFVLERSALHGQLGVREEIGVESPSRRATPEL